MEVTGALVAAAPILGSISNPFEGAGWSWAGLVVIRTKFQAVWFCASVVLNYICYVVLGLNWPFIPTPYVRLNPIMDTQFPSKEGVHKNKQTNKHVY